MKTCKHTPIVNYLSFLSNLKIVVISFFIEKSCTHRSEIYLAWMLSIFEGNIACDLLPWIDLLTFFSFLCFSWCLLFLFTPDKPCLDLSLSISKSFKKDNHTISGFHSHNSLIFIIRNEVIQECLCVIPSFSLFLILFVLQVWMMHYIIIEYQSIYIKNTKSFTYFEITRFLNYSSFCYIIDNFPWVSYEVGNLSVSDSGPQSSIGFPLMRLLA